MNKQVTRTEGNSRNPDAELLIGCWSCFLCHGQRFDDGDFTQEFTSEGTLISIIRDGEDVAVFRHRYSVSGDKIIITDPPDPKMADRVELQFGIDEAGNLVTWDGGIENRYKRVSSPAA